MILAAGNFRDLVLHGLQLMTYKIKKHSFSIVIPVMAKYIEAMCATTDCCLGSPQYCRTTTLSSLFYSGTMFRGIAVSLLALTASLPAAMAIHEVNAIDCIVDIPEDYFVVNYKQITGGQVYARCYADAGEISIIQYGTVSYISGNNAGWFEYEPGDGSRYRHTFDRNSGIETNDGNGWGDFSTLHID